MSLDFSFQLGNYLLLWHCQLLISLSFIGITCCRGNQAYASGDLSKAEDHYTQGVNCISRDESSRSCLRALMLCYSNRAATRMSLGRLRDAISDCTMAAAIDPGFYKVYLRAAK